jgi:hypothetical protein
VGLLLYGRLDGCIDRGDGATDDLLKVNHTAHPDRQAIQVVEQVGNLAITEAIAAVQHRDGSGGLRPEAAWRHISRPRRCHQIAAAPTTDRMRMVRGDVGAHERHIPHVLDAYRAGIVQGGWQSIMTVRAHGRMMVAHGIDLGRVWLGSLVARMARLSTFATPTRCAGGTWWRRGWVGRRRFGRILRMLVEAGLELSEACLELDELLLLLGEHRQHGANKLPHSLWGGGPFLSGNPRRWCLVVHATSMRCCGTAVK